MKSIQSKINNVIGQLSGIKKMVDEDKSCIDVLTQLKAVKSAVAGIMENVVDNSFDNCIKTLSEEDKKLLINLKTHLIKK